VKNTFGVSVHSKEYMISVLFDYTLFPANVVCPTYLCYLFHVQFEVMYIFPLKEDKFVLLRLIGVELVRANARKGHRKSDAPVSQKDCRPRASGSRAQTFV
jgi:hypothetical protein